MTPMRHDEHGSALVAAWRRGDADAVRQVLMLHGTAMWRVALALCPRAEDAEEVVQEALLRAHRSLDRFDPARGELRAWLVGITANRAREVRRGLSRYGRLLERIGRDPYVAAPEPFCSSDDLALARRRLASLPAREREAFVLVAIEELSSAEAADVMGISDSTVRVLAARARQRLRASAVASAHVPLRVQGRER
jgi:RNA polymerase sigma-70 factor (ECF subfamily)